MPLNAEPNRPSSSLAVTETGFGSPRASDATAWDSFSIGRETRARKKKLMPSAIKQPAAAAIQNSRTGFTSSMRTVPRRRSIVRLASSLADATRPATSESPSSISIDATRSSDGDDQVPARPGRGGRFRPWTRHRAASAGASRVRRACGARSSAIAAKQARAVTPGAVRIGGRPRNADCTLALVVGVRSCISTSRAVGHRPGLRGSRVERERRPPQHERSGFASVILPLMLAKSSAPRTWSSSKVDGMDHLEGSLLSRSRRARTST
jgi:hypothetical protein